MKSISHDEFVVEELKADPEFLEEYINETMQEPDPKLFRIALQHIIKAKGFDLNVVESEKEAA